MKIKYIFQLVEAATGKRTPPVSAGALKFAEILSNRVCKNLEEEDFVLLLSVEVVTDDGNSLEEETNEFGIMFPLMRVSNFLDFLDDKTYDDYLSDNEEKQK